MNFLALIALCVIPSTLQAAETRDLNGRQYEVQKGHWMQVDPGGQAFRVNPHVITVKFRPGVQRLAEERLHRSLGGSELRRALTGFVDVKLDPDRDVFEAIDAYLSSGVIEVAEPNTFGEYTLVPNDTNYGSQWHLPQVSAEAVWDITTGDSGVIVAILDSGTELSHDDLGFGSDAYQNIWLNSGEDAWSDPDDPSTGNGVDDDLNGYTDDWKGYDFSNNNNDGSGTFFHGTAVAGVTAAKTNNGLGVAGVAGGSNGTGTLIMVAGVGDDFPDGSAIDDAVLYAAAEGARVVQLSLSVGQSAAIDAAMQMAYDDFNMVIVCASGNNNSSSVGYPSSNPNVIAAGATNTSDTRANFSNFGPDVEISAPGTGIWTLNLNDGYTASDGTSFSAPLVSGVVALMLAVNPGLTNENVRQILKDTADKVGGYDYNWNMGMPGHSQELGYGRVNALSAVNASGNSAIFADGFESGDTSAWTSAN